MEARATRGRRTLGVRPNFIGTVDQAGGRAVGRERAVDRGLTFKPIADGDGMRGELIGRPTRQRPFAMTDDASIDVAGRRQGGAVDSNWTLTKQKRRSTKSAASSQSRRQSLGAVFAAEHCRLGLSDVASLFNDRRNLRVSEKIPEALFVPIEDHPNPIGFHRIAIDGRTPGTMLLALFG